MLVGELQKNKVQRIEITVERHEDYPYISARILEITRRGKYRRTKKHITLNHACLSDFISLLRKADEQLIETIANMKTADITRTTLNDLSLETMATEISAKDGYKD